MIHYTKRPHVVKVGDISLILQNPDPPPRYEAENISLILENFRPILTSMQTTSEYRRHFHTAYLICFAADFVNNTYLREKEEDDIFRKHGRFNVCVRPETPLREQGLEWTDKEIDHMQSCVSKLTGKFFPRHAFRHTDVFFGPFYLTYSLLYGSFLDQHKNDIT